MRDDVKMGARKRDWKWEVGMRKTENGKKKGGKSDPSSSLEGRTMPRQACGSGKLVKAECGSWKKEGEKP
jgi:hypothetical protein